MENKILKKSFWISFLPFSAKNCDTFIKHNALNSILVMDNSRLFVFDN